MVYDAETQDKNKASEINSIFSLSGGSWMGGGSSAQQVKSNITSRLLNDNHTTLQTAANMNYIMGFYLQFPTVI